MWKGKWRFFEKKLRKKYINKSQRRHGRRERFARRRQRRNSIIGKICYKKAEQKRRRISQDFECGGAANEREIRWQKIYKILLQSVRNLNPLTISLWKFWKISEIQTGGGKATHQRKNIELWIFRLHSVFPLLAHIIAREQQWRNEQSQRGKKRVKSGKNEWRRWMRMYNFLSYFLLLLMCSMKLFHFVRAQPPLPMSKHRRRY